MRRCSAGDVVTAQGKLNELGRAGRSMKCSPQDSAVKRSTQLGLGWLLGRGCHYIVTVLSSE